MSSQSSEPITLSNTGFPLVDAVTADMPYVQENFEQQLRQLHGEDRPFVGVVEVVVEPTHRLYLCIVQGELHAAARWWNTRWSPLTIRRFFQLLNISYNARVTVWRADPILIKSLLIVAQKAPSLQTTSAVVKLDGLLQHLAQMQRDALLVVHEPSGLTLCYFLNGAPVFLESRNPAWRQIDEDNRGRLQRVVRETASESVDVSLYEDVNVHAAQDRDLLGGQWPERVVEFFLAPRFSLVLATEGGQEAKVVLKGSQFVIGRGPENDLVLSHPSVSRSHLLIRREQGGYFARDLDSRNGTMVNGRALTSATLTGGESLRVGDVALRFIREDEAVSADDPEDDVCEATMVRSAPRPPGHQKTGLLGWFDVIGGKLTGMRIELTQTKMFIGRTKGDVVVDDPKISREHGSIEWTPDGFLYVDLGSTNGSFLNQLPVTSQLLKPNDVLRLGETELQLHLNVQKE
ncbi:MAG TPA: FHA domain-containing protein [Nitrospiria bacterium]|nr:FHA domain-containing protein [Nitrospiria bacterium]